MRKNLIPNRPLRSSSSDLESEPSVDRSLPDLLSTFPLLLRLMTSLDILLTSDVRVFRIQLLNFKKFKSVAEALKASTCTEEGVISKSLTRLLKATETEAEQLAVDDVKLSSLIKENLDIQCLTNKTISELMRAIRANLDNLLGEHKSKLDSMRLALAHALGRYKVKFNPEKIDTTVVLCFYSQIHVHFVRLPR